MIACRFLDMNRQLKMLKIPEYVWTKHIFIGRTWDQYLNPIDIYLLFNKLWIIHHRKITSHSASNLKFCTITLVHNIHVNKIYPFIHEILEVVNDDEYCQNNLLYFRFGSVDMQRIGS